MPAGRIPKPVDQRHGHRKPGGLSVAKGPERRRIPRPPAGLLPSSRKAWRSYWNSKVARYADLSVDLPRIERWIMVHDQFQRMFAVFTQTPLVRGSTGQPVASPLAGIIVSLLAELRSAETDLGLSPLARLRLGIVPGEGPYTAADLMRFLNQRTDQPREREPWEDEWEEA